MSGLFDVFRTYAPEECLEDGYPRAWRLLDVDTALKQLAEGVSVIPARPIGVKDLVRIHAGHRCVRCGHPYIVGAGDGELSVRDADAQAVLEEFFPRSAQAAFDLALEVTADDMEALSDPQLMRMARRMHWSACDDGCHHGGPIRFRPIGTEEWGELGEHELSRPHQEIGLRTADWRRPHDGTPGQFEIQAAWRILTVHHLNGVKADLRWWNLAALCQRCHLVIQGKVNMLRVFPFKHSEWFKPYVAGWYASSYLGEELSRAEVMSRLDELLALERMA